MFSEATNFSNMQSNFKLESFLIIKSKFMLQKTSKHIKINNCIFQRQFYLFINIKPKLNTTHAKSKEKVLECFFCTEKKNRVCIFNELNVNQGVPYAE